MKKIFTLFLFIFISCFSFSQVNNDNIPKVNITHNQVVNGWAKFKTECNGCVSFYYQILKNTLPVKEAYQNKEGVYYLNYYYYYFYFFSNSKYVNGNSASTYLTNLSFYADGELIFKKDYILIEPGKSVYGAWIKTTNPNAYISFNWENAIIY